MPSRLLYLGCQPGQDVMDLQDGLNAVTVDPGQSSAYPPLAVDGVFGGKTAARVREFQQHNGLAADGVVGPATWGVLLARLQGIPGLQISRPVGGSGQGPACGTDGAPVYGKPSPGAGGGKAPAGGSVSGKGGGNGTGGSGGGKAAGGGHSPGGAKSVESAGKDWNSAYGGSYKQTDDSGAVKGGGGKLA